MCEIALHDYFLRAIMYLMKKVEWIIPKIVVVATGVSMTSVLLMAFMLFEQ